MNLIYWALIVGIYHVDAPWICIESNDHLYKVLKDQVEVQLATYLMYLNHYFHYLNLIHYNYHHDNFQPIQYYQVELDVIVYHLMNNVHLNYK